MVRLLLQVRGTESDEGRRRGGNVLFRERFLAICTQQGAAHTGRGGTLLGLEVSTERSELWEQLSAAPPFSSASAPAGERVSSRLKSTAARLDICAPRREGGDCGLVEELGRLSQC